MTIIAYYMYLFQKRALIRTFQDIYSNLLPQAKIHYKIWMSNYFPSCLSPFEHLQSPAWMWTCKMLGMRRSLRTRLTPGMKPTKRTGSDKVGKGLAVLSGLWFCSAHWVSIYFPYLSSYLLIEYYFHLPWDHTTLMITKLGMKGSTAFNLCPL